ncbi:hypothetical protein [Campylobacter sp. RM12651]|uniref:hypothetical protein n=1 Tax=Campylobacter sp. RM12651 TaxID=1660079 RepID=UPI001EFB7E02|nr:hypothetical protein [Campylobacter sp. RM12651]
MFSMVAIYSIYKLFSNHINNSIQNGILTKKIQDVKEKSCVDVVGYQLDNKTLTKIKNSSQYSLGSMFDNIQEKARKELKQKYIELSKKSDSYFIIEDENLISDIRTLEEIKEEMKTRFSACCEHIDDGNGFSHLENNCSFFYFFNCGESIRSSSYSNYEMEIYKDYYYCGKNTTRRKQ